LAGAGQRTIWVSTLTSKRYKTAMLDSTSDPNETVYFKKNSIDRSIGYLIGGVAVLLFFLLSVLGMGRVQSMSDQAVGTDRVVVPDEKSAEISEDTEAHRPATEQ
jgi:hypothetical protein